jgi:uncharacterized hydrophobic protein (TIGR00271 family)
MVLVLFHNLTNKDKSQAVERLISGSTPSQDFFFMILLSILTATFGLMLNSVAIIIGSMLIAPMLFPVLSLSLGIIMSDSKLIARAFYTILKAVVFGIIAAFLAGLLFNNHLSAMPTEILSRTQPSLAYLAVAIIAGFAGSFALVKPKLNETLPGIAISVALIPPIAVTGIGMAKLSWPIISGSFLLFIVNTIGVIFASMITFSLMNFYVKRSDAKRVVIKEDQKAKREVKRAEKEIEKRS